jgi:hypothetical protein
MRDTPPHLKTLEEIEREGIPGLVELLREEGLDTVRYVLWDATGWHRDYSPPTWRNRATAEQKRKGWEMAVRIEKDTLRGPGRGTPATGRGDDGNAR